MVSHDSNRIGVVLERIVKTITRYNMFNPGDRVGLAVSGGADSVFLLHALFELAPRWDLKLEILHLDHECGEENWRAERGLVGELAARFRWPAIGSECDEAGLAAESGDHREQAAG